MASAKKRTTNFSIDEKRILTELVLKYHSAVENKRTDSVSNAEKVKAWIKMAEEFNNLSDYRQRTHTEIKCCWDNLKKHSKKERIEAEKRIFRNVAREELPSTPVLNGEGCGAMVEAVLGVQAINGNPNICDSGNEEDWVQKYRIPNQDNNGLDALIKEKIELVQILKQNALRESQLRIAILEEQLKQEKQKTQNLMGTTNREVKVEFVRESDDTGTGSQEIIWNPDSADTLHQEN